MLLIPLQKAPFFKKLFLNIMKTKLFFLAFLTSLLSWGQTDIPNTTSVIESFNSMGTSTTNALPATWRYHKSATPSYASGTRDLVEQASTGTPTAGSGYNWGSSTTERSPGVMTSGGYVSPSSIMGFFRNTNVDNLTSLSITYDVERYRRNSANASVQFYYSTNGSTWTALTTGDVATTDLPTGTSAYGFPQLTFNKTAFTLTFPTAIATNGTFYLRWNLDTTGSNSQGIGIDNVNLTATFAAAGPAPILSITPATTNLGTSCVGTPTTAVTYTITNSGTVAATGVTVVSSGTHNTNFVVSGLSSTTIAASGGTATYVVTFTPSAVGARNATITVASTTSGSNSPSTALTGTGNASIAQAVTSGGGATAVLDVSATLNGRVSTLGTCPATTSKGFVYSQTAINGTPTNGGTGVTTTPGVAVGTPPEDYDLNVTGLTPNTQYTYRAYVYNGTAYTYGGSLTFTTKGVPVVSNGSFTGVAGTAIATYNLSSLSSNAPTSYIITSGALPAGLSLNTTTGAITGTPTATGSFSIGFTASNTYGTSATSGTVTITINPSQNSDIVAVAGSSPATISSTVNTATISTVTDGVQAWSFTIRDGGASADGDVLPTTLTALTISQGGSNSVANWTDAIQSVAIFDGSTLVANGTVNATTIVFSGISVVAPDNGSETLTMRLSLKCPLGATALDGNDFDFSITPANTTFLSTGSGKNTGFSVASTPDNSVNYIEVLAAKLIFTTQPSTTGVSVTMGNVAVTAYDACGNKDLGFTGVVSLTSTGTMTGSPLSVNAVAGVATFSGIIHTATGTGFTMTATATGVTGATSNPFDIVTVTVLLPGDLFFVGYDGQYKGSGADDEYLVATLVPIVSGTTFSFVNSRYEAGAAANVRTNKWGVLAMILVKHQEL